MVLCRERQLTGGGSTKLPRAKGSLMKTVYDGSVDIVEMFL